MANHKVIQKSIYLCERTAVAVRLWQGGRQANPNNALHHHKCTGDNKVLGGSAQLTTGDVGGNEVTKKPRTGSC